MDEYGAPLAPAPPHPVYHHHEDQHHHHEDHDSYGSPVAEPITGYQSPAFHEVDSYGSPVIAPPVTGYQSPAYHEIDSYGSPVAPPITAPGSYEEDDSYSRFPVDSYGAPLEGGGSETTAVGSEYG